MCYNQMLDDKEPRVLLDPPKMQGRDSTEKIAELASSFPSVEQGSGFVVPDLTKLDLPE